MKIILISAFGAVLGIAVLLAASKTLETRFLDVDSISDSDVGKTIAITGRVENLRMRAGSYFFNVCRERCIGIALFEKTARQISANNYELNRLKNGNIVLASGILRKYKEGYSLDLFDAGNFEVRKG
ncbi:hypothetical protein HY989_05575 [Candidatus Micrarchaeota archaeon]|nr:hypothetical protein [Candidatus Micrarchaeota archaeon]